MPAAGRQSIAPVVPAAGRQSIAPVVPAAGRQSIVPVVPAAGRQPHSTSDISQHPSRHGLTANTP
ncbi:hypothetical protein D7Y51_14940 [Stenotrophomonas maltophilia]|nr:hypothetical protein [Stenotrophomonas maltophilia]